MANPKFSNFQNRMKSFGFAIQGIVVFFKTQINAWIHLLAAFFAVITGYLLNIERWEWCVIVIAVALVMVAELLNTALEFLTDLASPSVHPLAKKVKDIAAGAVLVAAIASVVIAAIVFIPKL